MSKTNNVRADRLLARRQDALARLRVFVAHDQAQINEYEKQLTQLAKTDKVDGLADFHRSKIQRKSAQIARMKREIATLEERVQPGYRPPRRRSNATAE